MGTGTTAGEAHAGMPGSIYATAEWQRIEQAYREIQRRDGSAEQRAWRWERFALVLVGLVVVLLGLVVWQLIAARKVQAVVQVVQLDEQGQLVQVGIPADLLTYTPPEGLWMDMLGAWVRRLRWHGMDTVLARVEWAWLYRHTCGQARRLLQTLEEREKPFEVKHKLVSVELKSVTKTPAPESYQVLWTETSTEQAQPTVKTAQWTGTFTVGRYRPPTLADTLDNRLGLCVTAFDLTATPQS
jgi:type IV secretory pathway TrbF-like protein